MTRPGRPLGLAILCVMLAGAPVWGQDNNPCPGAEMEESKPGKGDPTVDQLPRFDELTAFSHQARLRLRNETVATFNIRSKGGLQDLEDKILSLQKEQPTSKAQQRALTESLRLIERAEKLRNAGQADSPEMGRTLTHLHIVTAAYGDEFIPPIPRLTSAEKALKLFDETVATGQRTTTNPGVQASPFWIEPKDIATKDLHRPVKGVTIDLSNCEFDEPKGGYGTKGGFDINCGAPGKEVGYKLKFGPETRTEPFNSRIYNALGFNVPTVEYTPGVTVKYKRQIISQFNCRREIKAYVNLGVKLRFPIDQYVNPFAFIKSARLTNGQDIGMAELYRGLFDSPPPEKWKWTEEAIHDTKQNRPELNERNYKKAFEDQIVSLTWYEGSIEVKDKSADSIGAWDWNNEVYRDFREVRGAAVLSMWLGNYDVRADNNKIKLVENPKDKRRLAMYLGDIGAGLGDATNILQRENDKLNAFRWEFTVGQADASLHTPAIAKRAADHGIAVVNYLPDWENQTMTAVQRDDMLWMAKMIAQLTEDQIKSALIAASFQSAEVYLITEKLLNRREHLLRDAGGSDTVRPRLNDLKDYDPRKESAVTAKLPNGQTVTARPGREIPGREHLQRMLLDSAVLKEIKN